MVKREIGMQTLKKIDGEERELESYKLTSDAVKRKECAKSCMRNVVKLFD